MQKSISNLKRSYSKKYEFQQNLHGRENISLSSFRDNYWLSILGHYLIIIQLVIAVNF